MFKNVTLLPGEEFRSMEGFAGYSISNMGRVYSHKRNKLLKQQTANEFGAYPDHKYVRISQDGKYVNVYVHIQVAMAFIPNTYNQRAVLHKGYDLDDNRAEHLMWTGDAFTKESMEFRLAEYRKEHGQPKKHNGKAVTCTSHNIEFANMTEAGYVCDLGTSLIRILCETGDEYLGLRFKFKPRQIRCVQLDMVFDSFEEAAEYVGGRADWVKMCCKGQAKTHMKYRWEYVD